MDSGELDVLKQKELKELAQEYKKAPHLFKRDTFMEDAETLRPFGINIPNKENLPYGYIKFLPQDFIVEEVTNDGTVLSIKKENLISDSGLTTEPGQTIFATLVKCGFSTIDVINDLSEKLKCDKTQIQYAGIKDKDAITAQQFSFRNINFDELKKISSPHYFLKDARVGKGVIEKGGLKGNQFTILVRTNDSFTQEERQAAFIKQLGSVRDNGFYNFYYLQRFGTPRLINFVWGLDILKGDYKAVFESYLSNTEGREFAFFKNLRAEAGKKLGDLPALRALFGRFSLTFQNELKLINHLEKKPGDYSGALASIQEQSMLWVYGLSSLLFNEKISSYIDLRREPPASLPLFLSNIPSEVDQYKDLLQSAGIYPPPFKNLRPLPFIRLQSRPIPTKKKVSFEKAEIVEEGVALSFKLDKGEYATTFLSHIFNLMSDTVPDNIRKESIDTKKALGENDCSETIEHFKDVIRARDNNFLEMLAQTE